MNYVLNYVGGIIVIALLLLQFSCASASDEIELTDAELVKVALSLDFGEELNRVSYDLYRAAHDSEPGPVSSYVRALEAVEGAKVAQRELTLGERRLLGAGRLPSGRQVLLHNTIMRLEAFYQRTGRLPSNGAELYLDSLTDLLAARAGSAQRAAVFDQYADGVNPITGKFYSSFSAAEWQAGAMCVTLNNDEADIRRTHGNTVLPADPGNPTQFVKSLPKRILTVIIWGEQPGSVLLHTQLVSF